MSLNCVPARDGLRESLVCERRAKGWFILSHSPYSTWVRLVADGLCVLATTVTVIGTQEGVTIDTEMGQH